MAYPMDFRERVVRTHGELRSTAKVAEIFGCSESWVRRLIQRYRKTHSIAPRSSARTDDQRIYNKKDDAAIRKLIKRKPHATLAEVAAAIGKPASLTTVCRTLQRLNLTRKTAHAHRRARWLRDDRASD